MAQRVLKGVSGNFTCTLGTATAGGRIFRWEARYSQDYNDSTGFGSTWQQGEFGLQRWSGRAVGYLTSGATGQDPGINFQQQKANLTLTADATCNLTGTAVVTGISMVADENTNDALVFEFRGDGALAENGWPT
jgi:hypothetical protein